MGEFSIFRTIQIAAGVIFIAAFLRGIIWKNSEMARIHPVNRWLLLYGGIGLLILGIYGRFPRLF
jgi:hypothetical protein